MAAMLALGLLAAAAHSAAVAADAPAPADTCCDIIGCGLPLCDACGGGMGEGRGIALAKLATGGASVQHAYCCLRCLHNVLRAGGEVRLDNLSVVDSGSLDGHSNGQLISGFDAWFVLPATTEDAAALEPLRAYAAEETAVAWADTSGSTVIHGWDELEQLFVAEGTARARQLAQR
jgi:hypothetical protein